MIKILVNGKFDLLTPAHFNLLSYAREIANVTGELMVAIDTDDRIAKTDPMLPVFSMEQRIKHLKMLKLQGDTMIDKITVFQTDDDLIEIIKAFKPTIMLKGSDWRGKPVIGEDLVKIQWYDLEMENESDKVSSSDFIKTILQNYYDKRGI